MGMFVIGFLTCYVIFFILALFEGILDVDAVNAALAPLGWIVVALCYIPKVIWHIFRHLVKGVTPDRMDVISDLPHFNIGKFYVFLDTKAHFLGNKIFFLRVKKPKRVLTKALAYDNIVSTEQEKGTDNND
jgi:hypothetical protein